MVLLLVALAEPVAAQSAPCTPVLLCPQPSGGSGGRGGSGGGAGIGGRSGAGGRGGAGATGGLIISAPLELDKRFVKAGSVLNASVGFSNTSASAIAVREIRIAARAPGASHEAGPFTDLAPVLSNLTVEPGQQVMLGANRTFMANDTLGQWEAYATHQDSAGRWHDGPSERFAMVASDGPPPSPSGKMEVGTQEWFIASWAGTQIFKPSVDWATAYASGVDIWNPQFLADLQGFVVFRHMDTAATNFSKIHSWSQRKLPTDPRNQEVYIDGASPASTTGLAVEWQIDLCNRAGIDCWFTHPYLADDAYISAQAQLIQAKLAPQLKAYIELSNEVWNGSFSAFQQAIDAGKAGGLPGSNDWYKGIAHEMYRALAIFQLYQGVFGEAAMGSRIIRVFSESGNLDLTTQALANVYRSEQWNPHEQRIDALMLAPYIGNGVNGASETLARWKSEVDSKVAGEPIATAKSQASSYSIPAVGCYEAGMHHLQSADAWARNAQAYDGYVYMLDRFATKLNAPCCMYTLHGTWEPKGAWGLFNNVGQAVSAAPKARGAKDWIAGTATRAAPAVPITIIVLVALVLLLALAIFLWLKYRKP
jgi:hypothetical protein